MRMTGMSKIAFGIMGLSKNLGGDDRVKEPYWGPFSVKKFPRMKSNDMYSKKYVDTGLYINAIVQSATKVQWFQPSNCLILKFL